MIAKKQYVRKAFLISNNLELKNVKLLIQKKRSIEKDLRAAPLTIKIDVKCIYITRWGTSSPYTISNRNMFLKYKKIFFMDIVCGLWGTSSPTLH